MGIPNKTEANKLNALSYDNSKSSEICFACFHLLVEGNKQHSGHRGQNLSS